MQNAGSVPPVEDGGREGPAVPAFDREKARQAVAGLIEASGAFLSVGFGSAI